MLLLGIHSIIVVHRFFGPIFRIKVLLKQISKGDFSVKCILRKGDYAKDLQDTFNEMLDSMNIHLKEISHANMKNSSALTELASDLRKKDVNKFRVFKKIKEIQGRINNSDAVFKIRP